MRTRKGFTLIELLVVIVIIGILVAIALPNFIKVKTKAREAEVKQNLHSIQLGIERYAVDNAGNYPFFLYGGDTYYNIGTVKWIDPYWIEVMGIRAKHPFDMFNENFGDLAHTYPNNVNGDALTRSLMQQGAEAMQRANMEFGDMLVYEGYISRYPMNPFLTKKASLIYGWESIQWNGWIPWRGAGGADGRSMFNLGWSGEGPSLMAYDVDGEPADQVKQEFPGNFYYHPRYGDGASNADHYTAQWQALNDYGGFNPGGNHVVQVLGSWTNIADVWSSDVAGYDLLAFGDPGTDGMDIDYAIASSYKDYPKRTGYLNNVDERNPHNPPDYGPRTTPDGVPDFYILHLSSSLDAKPQGVI